MSIQNKFEHAWTGFVGCYTLITCNTLPFPFTAPSSATSGYSEHDQQLEKTAIEARTHVVTMEKSYDQEIDVFPFT